MTEGRSDSLLQILRRVVQCKVTPAELKQLTFLAWCETLQRHFSSMPRPLDVGCMRAGFRCWASRSHSLAPQQWLVRSRCGCLRCRRHHHRRCRCRRPRSYEYRRRSRPHLHHFRSRHRRRRLRRLYRVPVPRWRAPTTCAPTDPVPPAPRLATRQPLRCWRPARPRSSPSATRSLAPSPRRATARSSRDIAERSARTHLTPTTIRYPAETIMHPRAQRRRRDGSGARGCLRQGVA